jgi:hypothetical protein
VVAYRLQENAMKWFWTIVMLAGLTGACSTDAKVVTRPDAGASETVQFADSGASEILFFSDLGLTELPLDLVFGELAPADTDASGEWCAPGEGCFLDPCLDNSDCQSGWCVEHMGDGVCSQSCVDECPQGWSCKQVGASDPDLVYVCVSNYSNLCKPCGDAAGCKAVGGAEDVCVDYGQAGSFCGGPCSNDDDCPAGFSCLDATTIDGIATAQCVADEGTCACTDKSIALSLWTPCGAANEFGTCPGKRICTMDGLTNCDAPLPLEEICNGLDDDCDGDVDEPSLWEGVFVHLCDDGNPCTEDLCSGADGCTNEALEAGSCDDADPCTVADHCVAGDCVGNPVACNDDNPCTDDSCNGLGGCQFVPNSAPCDDQDPCTVADQCQDGACSGTGIPCDCQSDADCGALEDGDLCNGTLYCNLDAWPYKCEVIPETVVSCPEPEAGPNAICLKGVCEPATGSCALIAAHEGYACNDGNACTTGDTCVAGTCQGGGALTCNDSNICTADTCDEAIGCLHTPAPGPCDDGNACTTQDQCVDGTCKAGQAVDCDDDNVCTDNGCDPAGGCVTTLNSAPCDDNDLCTTGDHCHLGECISSGVFPCNDSNPCTIDSCNPQTGCVFQAGAGACDDGNACTTDDICTNGLCQGKATVVCNDDNPCTDDLCDPQDGCISVLNQAPCNDGNLCTANDTCSQGVCQGGPAIVCNDNNPCTDDSCLQGGGCVFKPNTAGCNDQNACTLQDQCSNGSCIGSGALSCDDTNICTADQCDPALGCLHSPVESICDDANPCTVDDACHNGVCTGGGTLDCSDSNLCTKDLCAAPDGCYYEAADILPCDDGNVCTSDSCVPASGCVFAQVQDYTNCGPNQVCLSGKCKAAPEKSMVFITQGTWTGNLGGLAGADQKCQAEADAAGLDGLFVAFLSTSTINAKDRIPDSVYLRVDKTVIADSKADLLDGTLDAPINLTAKGAVLTSVVRPWTGTKTDGTKFGNTCQNWTADAAGQCSSPGYTSRSGEGTATNGSWTDLTNYCCWATFTRLYCFQTLP